MKTPWFLTSEGSYGRGEYFLSNLATSFLSIALILLALVSPWFLVITIPGVLLLWYISVIAAIKRLHDLDLPGDDYFKLFIPIVGTVLDWKLAYKGGKRETEEQADREYNIQQYEKRYGKNGTEDNLDKYVR